MCESSVTTDACETWTLKETDRDKILVFEIYCYRRILDINWTQRVTNKDVRQRLGIQENLLQAVIRRKLILFGHGCRMNDKRKLSAIMLGIMEGTNKRGRPRRELYMMILKNGARSYKNYVR